MDERSADKRIYQWMTWEEIAHEAAAGSPVVIPIGATEQHGPHLPVRRTGSSGRSVRLASAVRRIVAGPSLNFGYRSRPASGGGQNFPGTLSLRATTFMAVIEDVLGELIRTGFRNIVLYNWHFENANFVYEPAFLVSEQASRRQDRRDRKRHTRAVCGRSRRAVARRLSRTRSGARGADRDRAVAAPSARSRPDRADERTTVRCAILLTTSCR